MIKNCTYKIPTQIFRNLNVNISCTYSTSNELTINQQTFDTDKWTNITPKIISYIGKNLHTKQNHPISIVRKNIVDYFYKTYTNSKGNPLFSVYDQLSPIVSVQQNFDNLLIPKNHPSRANSDCYYLNANYLLRAHTTAHQVDLIKSGLDNFLAVGDVYRRDEIDSTHYPVFHQLDGVRLLHQGTLFKNNPGLEIFETSYKINTNSFSKLNLTNSKCLDVIKQPCHTLEAVKLAEHEFKTNLVGLVKFIFGEKIEFRWVDTYFPFTQPSWELEIYYCGKWLEVLGSGIIRNEILVQAGVEKSIGYAFGMGLERLAMILFDIPDIRLFWSTDSGFLNQFNEYDKQKSIKYSKISSYPQCKNDLSFWLPENISLEDFCLNDVYDIARNIGGDIIEQIALVDKYKDPKKGKISLCFRIVYRHMERTLSQEEVNEIHKNIGLAAENILNVKIR